MQRYYIEYLGDSVEIAPGETVVGRGVGCALRFNDPAVSRRHLRLIRRDNTVFVEDLGSNNGTLVNGRIVRAPTAVHAGDIIRIGSRELTIRVADATGNEPSTLKDFPLTEDLPELGRALTKPIATTLAQRCPRCASIVSDADDECAVCGYRWGSFRPMNPTDVGVNPLDRRRHDRHSLELHLVYTSSELEIEAMTRDLSESGVFVCSEVLDAIGTECQLTILVDGGPPLRVRGIVRRVVEHYEVGKDPVGLGVEFTEVGVAERARLAVLAARSTSPGAPDR